MERWLDFTEFFSLAVLFQLPWDNKCPRERRVRRTFEKMWTLLRRSVLYFMRYEDCQHSEEGIMNAQSDLLQYGAIAERVRHCITVSDQ